jgi:hypothetical protein
MRVLVGCESSGKVREAFRKRGHEAWSCDYLPADDASPFHLQDDIRNVLRRYAHLFDLFIVHPTCTFLCNSGSLHLYNKDGSLNEERWYQMAMGALFFREMLEAPIDMIAAENPIMHKYAAAIIGRRADQFVQPWQHGHGEIKATGLHLKNLPKLQPTNIVSGRVARIHRMSPGKNRWKQRSETYQGIADAMAAQWGVL